MSWQGEQKRLNTCSPAAASCAKVVPVEAARAIPAITHVLIIFSLSRHYRARFRRRPTGDRTAYPPMASADLQRSLVRNGVKLLEGQPPKGTICFAAAALVSRFRSSHHYAAHSFANFGIKGTLAIYDSSAGFGFEVPTQTRGYSDRNFKSTALGPRGYSSTRTHPSGARRCCGRKRAL